MRCSATSVSRRQTERDAPNSVSAERRRRSLICRTVSYTHLDVYKRQINPNVLHMTKAISQKEKNIQLLHIFDVSLLAGEQGSRIEQKYILPVKMCIRDRCVQPDRGD